MKNLTEILNSLIILHKGVLKRHQMVGGANHRDKGAEAQGDEISRHRYSGDGAREAGRDGIAK